MMVTKAQSSAQVWSVQADQRVQYEVREAPSLLDPRNPTILTAGTNGRILPRRVVIIDEAVEKAHGERIKRYMRQHSVECNFVTVKASESCKTIEEALRVVAAFETLRVSRREPVLVMGGGVVHDIGGLAASLYRRGVPFIQVPTTLMAYVDAGIGVKTGVNLGCSKNRLGSYYPPVAVLLDRTFLRTLSEREIRNGLAEILKMALVKDRTLFTLLERHARTLIERKFQPATPSLLVLRRAIQGMLEELEGNLWERQLNRLVDFGHAFSPAIEMQAQPELLHGEAVTVDMALSTILAQHRGFLLESDCDRVFSLIEQLKLPVFHPVCTVPLLAKALEDTVRHRDGQQRLPLPIRLGLARFVNDITQDEILAALHALQERSMVQARQGLDDPALDRPSR